MDTFRVYAYLTAHQVAWLDREAGERGCSRTQIIRDLVRQAMLEAEREAALAVTTNPEARP